MDHREPSLAKQFGWTFRNHINLLIVSPSSLVTSPVTTGGLGFPGNRWLEISYVWQPDDKVSAFLVPIPSSWFDVRHVCWFLFFPRFFVNSIPISGSQSLMHPSFFIGQYVDLSKHRTVCTDKIGGEHLYFGTPEGSFTKVEEHGQFPGFQLYIKTSGVVAIYSGHL